MKKITVPILMPIDVNYVRQMLVTVYSLFKNAKDNTHYIVYILTPSESYEGIKEKVEKYHAYLDKHEIRIIPIAGERFQEEIGYHPIFPPVVYYRLFADQFITDFDKCIYLDTDIIVQGDLQEIYNIELGDYYVCGVKDHTVINVQSNAPKEKQIKINWLNYINAGVLVMNLRLLREKGLKERFMEEMRKGHWLADQDTINICCENQILHMPLRYNMRSIYMEYNYSVSFVEAVEGYQYWKDEVENVQIIHYASVYDKPWKQSCIIAGDLWWNYAEGILDEEDILVLKSCIKDVVDLYDIANMCKGKNKVYLYGYTQKAIELVKQLKRLKVENLECFIDKRADSLAKETLILPVKNLEDIVFDESILVINMGVKRKEEITKTLLKLGIEQDEIVEIASLHYKDNKYYEALPYAEYEREVNRIIANEYGKLENIEKMNFEERCCLIETDDLLKNLAYVDRWLLFHRKNKKCS